LKKVKIARARKTHKAQDTKYEISFFDREETRKIKSENIRRARAEELEEKIEDLLRMMKINVISDKKLMALDVGCGIGGWSLRLTKKKFNVIAIDISAESIKIARNKSKKEKLIYSVIRCDALKTPFKSNIFDICFCAGVLHHFRDLKLIISEISRILKNNSRIIAYEPNGLNIVHRFTSLIKRIFTIKWLMKHGMATANETIHNIQSYECILQSSNFVNIKTSFYLSADQAIMYDGQIVKSFFHDSSILIGFIMLIFCLSFKIVLKIAPKSLGMGSVVITATNI